MIATKPIGLFAGHRCANVPNASTNYCDHLVEQLPAVSAWGREALLMPLATRVGGDTYRILAHEDDTELTLSGPAADSWTMAAGEARDLLLDDLHRLEATKPVLVAQLSNGSQFDGVTSDPFMMLIPPSEQFLSYYTFATPVANFSGHYVNLVARATDVAAQRVLLDGEPLAAELFSEFPGSNFVGTQIAVENGTHTVEASQPLGVFVYGYGRDESYGYPGGLSFDRQL